MQHAIAVDSSADLLYPSQIGLADETVGFGVAPLKINAGERHFVDDESLDVVEMVDYLGTYHGKSGTACPSTGEWIAAFRGAKEAFGVTITSRLSGSYNSALVAKETYEAENPGAQVHIVDSLATGPQMWMIAEKLRELIEQGLPFEKIREEIELYRDRTETVFALGSLDNLANNGRVNPVAAKVCGVLGIRIVGAAVDGQLDPTYKARGEKKALSTLVKIIRDYGYQGGKLRIAHVINEAAALKLKALLEEAFPGAQICTNEARGLDSFYAEKGGLIVGFEAF